VKVTGGFERWKKCTNGFRETNKREEGISTEKDESKIRNRLCPYVEIRYFEEPYR